jgi:hypothetical protein
MSDGMEGIIPTVVGGVVALKLLDVVTDKRGKTVYVYSHVKHHKHKKKRKLKKVM